MNLFGNGSAVSNFPNNLNGTSRRRFMKTVFGGTAAAAFLPYLPENDIISREEIAILSNKAGTGERFWEAVRSQFPVTKGLVMINAANLCPSPWCVQQEVFHFTRDLDQDASFPNRNKFNSLRESAREALADYLGASSSEIAIVRNTSEGNNTVISGLDLGEGDEVVIWDQNHPTANIAWDVRADRYGYTVKRVSTPEKPASPDELVKSFTDAFTDRTRAVAFSHVSNVSGIRIDAKKLCAEARSRGILTLVDGAQTFGTYPLKLNDMGCDFFTGSSHKWFCGPKEVGILYVRRDRCEELHPLSVGVGWESSKNSGAVKFETLGQRDDSRISAMLETVRFHNSLGMKNISTRAHQLADAVKMGLKRVIPDVQFITPETHDMSWGVVVFNVPGMDTSDAMNTLYRKHNIGCAVMNGNIRYSPNIYNTLDEVEQAVDAVTKLL